MIHEIYKTTDLCLAAVLRLNDNPLKQIELSGRDKTRGVFHFENVDSEFLFAFNQGEVRVDPCEYHAMQRRLTDSIRRLVDSQNAEHASRKTIYSTNR